MVKNIIADIAGITGFGLVIYGIHLINKESAYITAGILLMTYAYRASK